MTGPLDSQADMGRYVDGLKLQYIEYLGKRLDHTLTHTQTSTRLIYLVNAAIIALASFGFGPLNPLVATVLAQMLVLALAVVNSLHVLFLWNQKRWYTTIDKEIWLCFKEMSTSAQWQPRFIGEAYADLAGKKTSWRKSTHGVYMAIHIALTGFLLLVLVASLFAGAQGILLIKVSTGSP